MKPAPFSYCRPTTLDEVVGVLDRHGGDARVLAGGQSLVPLLNGRRLQPGLVVDINRVDGLSEVVVGPDRLAIGANVRQAHRFDARALPLLTRALPHVGHAQTRNRGTVCGSLAHADPLAEVPLVMLVTGGEVELRGRAGRRLVDIDAFLDDAFAPAIAASELMAASHWRVAAPGSRSAFVELAHGVNLCAAAALVEPSDDGDTKVRIGVNGTVGRPRMIGIEISMDRTRDTGWVDDLVGDLVRDLVERWDFVDDHMADGVYRRALARELATRVLADALAETTGVDT